MDEKEKILRDNLQEAYNEKNKPLPQFDMISIASVSFAVMKERDKNIKKCQKELDEYLNFIKPIISRSDIKKRIEELIYERDCFDVKTNTKISEQSSNILDEKKKDYNIRISELNTFYEKYVDKILV